MKTVRSTPVKVCTVIGARPQFIKAAAVSAKFAEYPGKKIREIIVHTGQHYDHEMSKLFFKELGIPHEKYNLETGSVSHGAQTERILEKLEKVLISEKPDVVLVYGDTNSTLAGALAAAKLCIPLVHIEAGMRSFNRTMPEEINRIVSDHLANINFCSTETAMRNLKNEGRGNTAVLVGDVMFDCALKFEKTAEKFHNPLKKLNIKKFSYILMTCHRAENTDDKERLSEIIKAANRISKEIDIVFPIHPRTKKYLNKYKFKLSDRIRIIRPAGYLEMLVLEKNAKLILTDSGGIQKEAFFYRTPCVTMRNETEWVETVELGWNKTTGANSLKIYEAIADFIKNPPSPVSIQPYGNGNSAEKIVEIILSRLSKSRFQV